MSTTMVHSEIYRGVRIAIEHTDDHSTVAPFAAHVAIPGHGYIDHYFDTQEAALAAALQLVDSHEPDGEGDALTADMAAASIAATMVDDVTAAICSLVAVACQRDETQYRSLLELVAQRLGGV